MDDFSLDDVESSPPWTAEKVDGDDLEKRDLFSDILSPEPGDFIPDSLAAFINEAKATLQDAQLSLQTHFAASPMSTTIGGDEDDWIPKHNGMLEDEDDRRLRQDLMNQFERKQRVSPRSDVVMSPSPMNTTGMTAPSGQKSEPSRGKLSEDIFMTPGFENLNGDDSSFLVEEEFSPAMEYLEPDSMVDRIVERPHRAEAMTMEKVVPMCALGSPTTETFNSLQSRFDETKGTPVSMSVTPEIIPNSVTNMTPRIVSDSAAVKSSASQLTSEPPPPVESNSKNLATHMSMSTAIEPERITSASSERKRTSPLRISGRKVAPMPLPSAPSPINPSPVSEANSPRLVVKTVGNSSKSGTTTPVSHRANVHASSNIATIDDVDFLPPVIDLGDSSSCDYDAAFLPNSKPISVLTASEPKKIVIKHKVDTKPSVTNRATIPKPSVPMAFVRPSLTTTKPKTVTPPLPKSSLAATRLQNFVSTAYSTKPVQTSTTDNGKVPDDGVAKARARIKQRQLLNKQKESAELVAKSLTMSTKSALRDKLVRADEAQARARERVRQQQLYTEKTTSEAKLRRILKVERALAVVTKPKPPAPMPSNFEETNYTKLNSATPSVRPIRPHLTIPKAPRLSVTAKYGEKPTPSVQERKEKTTFENSVRIMSQPRGLTQPKGPKLSTQAKYGHKPPPSLWEDKQKQLETNVDATRIKGERPRLTKPVPFNFRVSKMTTPARSKEKDSPSLAECELIFMQKGLRENSHAMDTKRELTLTIPKSPNFTPIARRSVPKSTAEKEEEIMNYYNSHPFKASQVRWSMSSTNGQGMGIPKVEKRRVTMPEPFHLKSAVRTSESNSTRVPTEEERAKADLEECKKQFQARPLPNLTFRSPSKSEAFQLKTATTPEPFRLMSEERRAKVEPPQPTEDDKEMKKQFKARPLPISTFIAPPPRRTADGIPLTIITKEQSPIQPPKLATADRSRIEKREAAKEVSRQNSEIVSKQKERMRLRKQHEKHLEDMANAKLCSPTTPTQAEPFRLSSTIRHESCRRRLEEKRQEDLETENRRRTFLARPMMLTPPPPPRVPTHKPLTRVQPFQLKTEIIHDRHVAERLAKEKEQEQERRRLATIKARPLPNFQNYKPITPMASQNLVEARSPELASSRRAQERKYFDEKVERDKQEEAARKKAIADHQASEQAAELQELRRLPVSEGGLIPRANPINAGLE